MTTTSIAVSTAKRVREMLWDRRLPVNAFNLTAAIVIDPAGASAPIKIRPLKADSDVSIRISHDESGKFYLCEYQEAEVFNRSNFAMAYALGHVLLGGVADKGSVRQCSVFSPKPEHSCDRVATEFAIELLMPERHMRDLMPGAANVQQMATAFGVSNAAMMHRMRALRLI